MCPPPVTGARTPRAAGAVTDMTATTEVHEVVLVDSTTDPYRTGPARRSAYCAKTGCRWRWNGIGSYEFYKTEHEHLNDSETS